MEVRSFHPQFSLLLFYLTLMTGLFVYPLHSFQPEKAPIKIACVGNSITYGSGIGERDKYSYPAQLQEMLGGQFEVRNFGVSGRTLLSRGDYPYRHEKEFLDAKRFLPDIVIIMLGTNDSKPQNWRYKNDFQRDYISFVQEFKTLPSHPRIYVCTPLPAFPGDWGINDTIIRLQIIPRIKALTLVTGVSLIDLYHALESKSELFPDKVHPDGDGANVMARHIYSILCRDYHLVPAPEPLDPVPTVRQRMWEDLEYCAFIHFNMNTFTNKEWGYGDENPDLFHPADLNTDEIARTVRDAGMKELILTCKHHDGFCLWPSDFTTQSVRHSHWLNDTGDVVKEFSESCRKVGIGFGVYLSPWDRNHAEYGKPEYISFYRNQLRELLTRYGPISEVWFDGANGGDGYYGGMRETRVIDRTTYYGWSETWKIVRELQPEAVIFSDVGPDVRWVGNENGFSGDTCWSTYTPVGEKGDEAAPGYVRYEQGINGTKNGKFWIPAECDVSIRPGWFYHPGEDSLVKTPEELFDLYVNSVGHNASLLLNIPPQPDGHLNRKDVQSLYGLKKLIDTTFAHNLVDDGSATSSNIRGNDPHFAAANSIDSSVSTYWATDDSVRSATLEISWNHPVSANVIMLGEYIPLGQRVEEFSIEAWWKGRWEKITQGSTIGRKRLFRIPRTQMMKLRVNIYHAKACPAISTIGVYNSPVITQQH